MFCIRNVVSVTTLEYYMIKTEHNDFTKCIMKTMYIIVERRQLVK